MQPFVFDRKYYESSLFQSIKMIDAHLQLLGFQSNIEELMKALKEVETPSLEECAIIAGAMYRVIRKRSWGQELLKEACEQESQGVAPHFKIEAKYGNYRVHLLRIAPTDKAWLVDQPERL